MNEQPKWRRRRADRPAEIADAALALFGERGYAATRVADIAARAGVSKAALFVYYPTKADLFRAVVATRAAPNITAIAAGAAAGARFEELLDTVLSTLVATLGQAELRRLARMIIAESGNFPELAQTWHDSVVAPALAAVARAVAAGQALGEVRRGDPALLAMTVVAPFLAAAIWTEVMVPAGGAPVDLAALASEHRQTLMAGLRSRGP